MVTQLPTRFDSTYYQRYVQRNRKKIETIVRNVGKSKTLLDIGCNQGYVIRTFLEKDLVDRGCAVELSASVVDPWLIGNKRFSLFEGNVLDYTFDQTFDVIIFNSVFHHIFGTYGKDVALNLWDRIIDHCDRVLIFETGVLTEFGQYYWKDELLKYYLFDDELIKTLLGRVGSRLKSCEPIISLPIHLTQRLIYKIELHPVESEYNLKRNEINLYGDYYKPDSRWTPANKYKRTPGSDNQQLIEIANGISVNEQAYSETEFFRLQAGDSDKSAFGKKIINDTYKRLREFFLLKNINHPHVARLLEMHPDYGFIFDYLDWQCLGNLNLHQIEHPERFVSEIKSFFQWSSQQLLVPDLLDFNPTKKGLSRRLIDMVDLHPNNFLVKLEDGEIQDWMVVDLEYAFNRGANRNHKHLYGLLRRFYPHNPVYICLYFYYFLQSYLNSDIKICQIFLRYFYDFLAKPLLFFKSYFRS
jgi:hypothetical protein